MIAAIPLGLMSAIYLTQYARPKVRSVLKPVLEVLAGVPTVVYGYFAALTVAPAVREFAVSIGISNASSESALAAGMEIGRAARRERVCQYVWISGVAGSLKNQRIHVRTVDHEHSRELQ